MEKDTKEDAAIMLLGDAKDLIKELGWSRNRYIERDEGGAPVAFDIIGALQFATVRGNFPRSTYLLAKDHLEEVVRPLTLTGFNRLANNSKAILKRYDLAIERLKKEAEIKHECKVIPFRRKMGA